MMTGPPAREALTILRLLTLIFCVRSLAICSPSLAGTATSFLSLWLKDFKSQPPPDSFHIAHLNETSIVPLYIDIYGSSGKWLMLNIIP